MWGRGVGSAAYDLVERTARENGRTVLQSWAEHPDAPGPRLAAPTGFGTIPEDHAARFYVRHGYTLEQIERNSAFDLRGPFDGVEASAGRGDRSIRAATGVVQWFAPTPAEFVDGYAWMKSRMVTDAPAAGLEFDEETWDAARIARHDSIYTDVGPAAAGHRGAAHRHRRALRLQRARHRQGPHRGLAPGGHARPQGATAATSSGRSSSAPDC